MKLIPQLTQQLSLSDDSARCLHKPGARAQWLFNSSEKPSWRSLLSIDPFFYSNRVCPEARFGEQAAETARRSEEVHAGAEGWACWRQCRTAGAEPRPAKMPKPLHTNPSRNTMEQRRVCATSFGDLIEDGRPEESQRERVIQCQKLWEEDQSNSVPIFGVGACRSANLDSRYFDLHMCFANLNVPRIQQLMMEMSENSLLHETMAAEHEILKKCQDCKNNTISCSQANWCDVGWRKSSVFIQGSRTCCRKAMLPVHPFKKTLPLDLQCSTAKEGEVQSAGSPQENESAATNHERETQLSVVHLSKRKSRLTLDGSFHFYRWDCGFFLFASQPVETCAIV